MQIRKQEKLVSLKISFLKNKNGIGFSIYFPHETGCCREIVRFKVKEAAPKFALSGLTIDNEGFLYFCVYDQGNIYKLNPL